MFTKRLNIQQLTAPLDEQADWLNDPRNTEFSEQRHRHHDKQSCAKYIQKCSMFWGIQEVDSGEWIGTIAAHIDEHNEIADLGILIHHEYSGKRYGVEAWVCICDFLLNERRLRKVEAGFMATNKAMQRVCEVGGMQYEGDRKNHFLTKDGHPVSLYQYGKWPGGRV